MKLNNKLLALQKRSEGESLERGFRGASGGKNLPAVQKTQIRPLGQQDPLEKGMATDCSILAWRIPCTEWPGGLHSMGSKSVQHTWTTSTFTFSREKATSI